MAQGAQAGRTHPADLPRLGFVHIPYTGGGVVTTCLHAVYGAQTLPAATTLDYPLHDAAALQACRFYKGHAYRRDHARLPVDTIRFTVLRNPVSRAMAFFDFCRGLEEADTNDGFVNEAIRLAKQGSIIEFMHHDSPFIVEHIRLGQVRQFLPDDILLRVGHRRNLTRELRRLTIDAFMNEIAAFAFVLTTESLAASFPLMAAKLGLRAECATLAAVEAPSFTSKADPIDIRRALLEVSPEDFECYDHVQQREQKWLAGELKTLLHPGYGRRNDTVNEKVAALPPLDQRNAASLAAPCKICGQPAHLFDVVDMQKHCGFQNQYLFGISGVEVPYLRCDACGFLFTTTFDHWTQDEWRRFIYNDDYIRVDPDYAGARPRRLAQQMAALLRGCEHLRILDYGAGTGVFAQELTRAGFRHVQGYDPMSSPAPPNGRFDIVTCLEVLEHTPSPKAAIADMHAFLDSAGCIVFSESVQPPNIEEIRGAWWYIAPRNGHISTFTVQTLTLLLPTPGHMLRGNGWLWAIVSPNLPTPLADAMLRVGPATLSYGLGAPAKGHDDLWYPAEAHDRGAFRWSKTAHLEWLMPPPRQYPAHVHVRLPFDVEINAGFAAGCKLAVGGVDARMRVTTTAILAEAIVENAVRKLKITLDMPQLRTPLELSGAPDGRALGLAVHVA